MTYRAFTSYEEFIYLSRYSRWIEKEQRREVWSETVDRVIECFQKQTNNNPGIDFDELHWAILNRDVMPSMRVMMTAGRALEQNHIAAYNCSFLAVDSLDSFSEALYVLMHGTGLGFSVTAETVNQLPVLSAKTQTPYLYIVHDSKEGWRNSIDYLVKIMAVGGEVYFDYSRIREEGARLKTFGGRASGPKPLEELHTYIKDIFDAAEGRQLTPKECHGIMCSIGAAVVVGGVRRSALISLSDLGDHDMSTAKKSDWWKDHPEYALANNSAIYSEKPTYLEWSREWAAIESSGSGERGIFNLASAQAKCQEISRLPLIGGTNPCGEILLRNAQFCNLSEVVLRPGDDLAAISWKVRVATIIGTIQSTFDNIEGLRQKWIDNTKEERLLGVSFTGIMDCALTNGTEDGLEDRLVSWRSYARSVNASYASRLGVPASAAISTIKPSGTVSQLCGTSSGIHPAHASKYIRRVRQDLKDPLTRLMMDAGVPGEVDFYNPKAYVFEFPIERDGLTRDDFTALEFLELWKTYKVHWTDHNPSVTVNLHEEEWDEVGLWVHSNFDIIGGLSFLPYDGGSYKQAPYETADQLPGSIEVDYGKLSEYETDDNTSNDKALACSAGVCEI